MAKDPAFLFYPGDWMGGTILFTRSHKGAYMDVLMAQFNHGHMAIEDIKNLLGCDFDSMWESKLKAKFKVDSTGLYYNEKLDNEINKRRKFTDSRKNNLKKDKPHMEHHMTTHMENENENENIIKDTVTKPKSKRTTRKPFVIPTVDQVVNYFVENGYRSDAGLKAFNFYNVAEWVDSKGNKVLNWKQKMQSVWFKDENKESKKPWSGPLGGQPI